MATPTLSASSALTRIFHITDLPIDIVVLFMVNTREALGMARDRFLLPIVLSSTCKAWNLIASSTPALWSTVWLEFGRENIMLGGLSTYLAKSDSMPLDIEIDLTTYTRGIVNIWGQRPIYSYKRPVACIEALLSHAARWNQFTIVNTVEHVKYSDPGAEGLAYVQELNRAAESAGVVEALFPTEVQLPMLSVLKLNLRLSPDHLKKFTVPDLPPLQSLILQRFSTTRLTDWPIRGLRELRLVYNNDDMADGTLPTPFSQLLRAISAASGTLEVLHIQMITFPSDLVNEIASEDFKTIDMPQLSTLYLIGLPEPVIYQLLTRIHTPNLVELAISGSQSSKERHWEPVREVFPKLGHLAILGFKSIEHWDNQEQFLENMISMAPNVNKLSLSLATAPFVAQISETWAFPNLRAVFVKGIKMGDWRTFVENRGAALDMVAIDVGSLALSGGDYESAFGKEGRDLQYMQTRAKLAVFGRRGVPEDEVLWDKWTNFVLQKSEGKVCEDKLVEEGGLWQWTRPFSFPLRRI